jgi:hypothetical protein
MHTRKTEFNSNSPEAKQLDIVIGGIEKTDNLDEILNFVKQTYNSVFT